MPKGNVLFRLLNSIRRIIYMGISPGIAFEERRRILIINVAGLLGGTSSFIMLFPNLFHAHYLLAVLNIVTWLTGYSVFFIHTSHHRKTLLLVVGFIYSLAAATSALFFQNGVECFLLIYAGVYFIVLEDIKMIVVYCLFNILLFIPVNFDFFEIKLFAPVSEMHRDLVALNGLFLFFFFLYYFKKQSQSYRNQIEVRNRELDRLNLEKEKLFAIIAHDIKTPISNLGTVLEMIRQGYLSPQDLQHVCNSLIKQVDSVEESLTTMLQWGNSQMKGMGVNPSKVGLFSLIERVVNLVQPVAEAKGLYIDMSRTRDFLCWIDVDHMELIVRNLLSNAIKFSKSGDTIYVRTREHGHGVVFEVQDEGVGISVTNANLLKQRFSFVSTYGTDNERGTGLGLNLCKDFILQNGGWIRFDSEEGKGSTFFVFIPLWKDTI